MYMLCAQMGSAETSLKSKPSSHASDPCSEGAFHMTLRQLRRWDHYQRLVVFSSQLKFAMAASAAVQRLLHLDK